MPQYEILVRRQLDGSIYIEANDPEKASIEAELMMERGSGMIDWQEPSDSVIEVNLQED